MNNDLRYYGNPMNWESVKGDLISREALKKKLQARHDNGNEDFDKGYNIGLGTAIDLIDSAPTVEYTFEEAFQKTVCENRLYCPARPQGEWIDCSEYYGYVECPFCHSLTSCSDSADELHFCWDCGARLGKGGAE